MTTRSTHRPPVSSASLATLDQRRAALAQALSELASFCRGQLHEVYKRCGKPGCACATDPARRHGPYYAWQRCINGRIIQRTLQPAEAARVREGIACYEHFQALHDAYVAAMEAVHMAAAQPALPAAQKKSRTRPRCAPPKTHTRTTRGNRHGRSMKPSCKRRRGTKR